MTSVAASLPSWRRRVAHFDRSTLIWAPIALVLVVLVVSPLLSLLLTSLEQPGTGVFTLVNYAQAYGRPRYVEALWRSVGLGVTVATLCLLIGVPIAWAVSRTDMPAKGFIRTMVLAAFVTPPYTGAIAWILLAGPNSGWLNKVAIWLTGASEGPFNIYSFPGLAFVMAIYSFPYAFIFTSAALELVSSEMEDAANILGSGIWRTTFRITLPMVLPAILGAAIISFLEAIALFGSPALIAIPARFMVVTTQLYQFFSTPIRVEVAAAYAMPLLGITIALFLLQHVLIRRKGFVALTGKGGERRPIRLGRWRWALFAYAMLICTLSVLLPYVFLVQASLSSAWGRGFSLGNLTLANFTYILFQHQSAGRSVVNSFLYAGITACAVIALALVIAYVVARRLTPFGPLLAFLCVAPFVIPGIVLAIGFYAAYAPPPLALYGTATILILAFTTRFLPIGYVNAAAAIRSLNPEMEEAVRILGGGRFTAIRKVVAPLLKRGLIGAWLLVFIPATRELSSAIFLYGPDTKTVSVMIFDLSEEGNFEQLSALALTLQVLTLPVLWLGFRIVGRDFLLRRSAT
jgi:iron(III) transport system permease protein